MVWDLDGTLFDPRPRMLHSVHAFGRLDATIDDVTMSWEETAARLDLDADAFFASWCETFWDDDAFAHDHVFAATLWALRWSAQRGADPVFLTGRVEVLRAPTQRQLERIAFGHQTVLMKGSDGDTAAFKGRAIARLVNEGVNVVAFVTDSRREIAAARAAVAPRPLTCILVNGDGDPGDDDDTPVWAVASSPPPSPSILPLGLPLTPWMLMAIAEAVSGDVDDSLVCAPVYSRDDVAAIFPDADAALDAAIDAVCRVGLEHQLNDKEGLARRHDGNVDAAFAGGVRFSLPLVAVPEAHAEVTRSQVHDTDDVEARFRADTGWLLPLHPQGLRASPVGSLWARATSSTRTVLIDDADGQGHRQPMALKCHAPALVLDRYPRTLPARDARHAVMVSDALATLGVTHFPEVFAVADVDADAACVVRRAHPWPAADRGAGSRTVPAYALWAQPRAFDGGPPLMVRLLSELGDDVVSDTVIRPLIELALRLSLELGCASMAHGQNVHVELGPGGRPSGRVVLADLEDIWPHPEIKAALGLPFVLNDAYIAEHQGAAEADIGAAFQDHFVWRLLHPMLQVAESLRPRANAMLKEGVVARADIVQRFSPGPLSWFHDTFCVGV